MREETNMPHLLTMEDLGKPKGAKRAAALVNWAAKASETLGEVFNGAPHDVIELAPALSIMLLEFGAQLAEVAQAVKDSLEDDTIAARFNRAAFIQAAILNLLNHLQRHAMTDIHTAIPQPDQLVPACVGCGKPDHDSYNPTLN